MSDKDNQPDNRLRSLDLFRGITMFLLVAEGSRLYDYLQDLDLGRFLNAIVLQFHHHPWHGFRFWDLIQPFFMFIVGVAMPFSYRSRLQKGQSKTQITRHILQRCIILFFLGVILHCGYNKKLVWELWNVLTQLSFTILVAYLIINKKISTQLLISIGLILFSDFLYRFTNISGYDQAFTQGKNFGAFMDMVLMHKINGGGWVAINALPTAAHTIWGVLFGKILLNSSSPSLKLKLFVISGLSMLIVGYTLDLSGISPVIKRICTSSFIFISGGWTILAMTFLYWIMDLKKKNQWGFFFILFGINPIFIYMFSQTVGYQWFNDYGHIFVSGVFGFVGLSEKVIWVINSIFVIGVEAYILYFLYKQKIYFKI